MGGRAAGGSLSFWAARRERAAALARRWPFAAEVLRLFASVTELQEEIHRAVEREVDPDWTRGRPERLAPFAGALLARVRRDGPPELAAAAAELGDRPEAQWAARLRAALLEERLAAAPSAEGYLLGALWHPWMVEVGRRHEARATEPRGICPVCEGGPAAGVLWEDVEAQATRRRLVCSVCAVEWPFPRVLCPSCLEERPERLPRLTAEEIPWVRLEACDSCGGALKCVDLTREPAAVPVVDALAAIPLDIVARERKFEV